MNTIKKNGTHHLFVVEATPELAEFLTSHDGGRFRNVLIRRQFDNHDFPHVSVSAPNDERTTMILDMTSGLRPNDIGWVFSKTTAGGAEAWIPGLATRYAYDRVLNPSWDGQRGRGKDFKRQVDSGDTETRNKISAFRRQIEAVRTAFERYQRTAVAGGGDIKIETFDKAILISYLADPNAPSPRRGNKGKANREAPKGGKGEGKDKRPRKDKPNKGPGKTEQGATTKLGDAVDMTKIAQAVSGKEQGTAEPRRGRGYSSGIVHVDDAPFVQPGGDLSFHAPSDPGYFDRLNGTGTEVGEGVLELAEELISKKDVVDAGASKLQDLAQEMAEIKAEAHGGEKADRDDG